VEVFELVRNAISDIMRSSSNSSHSMMVVRRLHMGRQNLDLGC